MVQRSGLEKAQTVRIRSKVELATVPTFIGSHGGLPCTKKFILVSFSIRLAGLLSGGWADTLTPDT